MGRSIHINAIAAAGIDIDKDTPADSLQTIEAITAEIRHCRSMEGETILWLGRCLIEAKRRLPYGKWLPWLKETGFSERTAASYMKLAREWKDPVLLSELGTSKAVLLLTLPSFPRAEFMSIGHTVNGQEKRVVEMSYRELQQAVHAYWTPKKRAEIRQMIHI